VSPQCLCSCVSLSVYVSLSGCVSHCVSLSQCVCLTVCVSVCVSQCACQYVVSLFLCLSLTVYVSGSLCVCIDPQNRTGKQTLGSHKQNLLYQDPGERSSDPAKD